MNALFSILFFIFRPWGVLYGYCISLRQSLYEKGIFTSYTVSAPVICVGNLTMGGSGKTPVVIHIAKLLQDHGLQPAVISRGYKSRNNEDVHVVADVKGVISTPVLAGDEPYLLAQKLPGVPVLTGKNRLQPSKRAITDFHSDILILDDGFQHLRLQRDLDLVLFNCSTLNKQYHVFPGGLLREPYTALRRSHAILFTNYSREYSEEVATFTKKISEYLNHTNIFTSEYRPSSLADISGNRLPLDSCTSTDTLLGFCGIAAPERFLQTLNTLQYQLSDFHTFSDHHNFTKKDMDILMEKAAAYDVTACITREKDMVKLRSFSFSYPVYALTMTTTFSNEFEDFIHDFLT